MNTAAEVSKLIADLKAGGSALSDIAWEAALACVGWAYVFGARGEFCDPSNRRSRARDDHPTIKSACINFNGSDNVVGNCAKCKWYPGGRTRFFDCRGFVYWVLLQVYGWKLQGAGATSQWNNADNWSAKGEISTMPRDTLCCIFVRKGSKMEHVGFGLNDMTCECSSGVQYFAKRKSKWTHWAVPKPVKEGEVPMPVTKPTLRRGSKGEYVKQVQQRLKELGYSLGSCGVDGDFGKATEAAVKAFQKDHGLKADGIVGELTYAALEEPAVLYTVTIKGLSAAEADKLVAEYPNAVKVGG